MNWLTENKEWIFSGIGVAIVTLAVRLLPPLFKTRPRRGSASMRQHGGDHSTNIQIGGDFRHGQS